MLNAVRHLIDLLDAFEVAQRTGDSPSPAEIRELFRVRDHARAEVAALTAEPRTVLDPPPPGETGRELSGEEATTALSEFMAGGVMTPSQERDALSLPDGDEITRIQRSLETAIAKEKADRALVHWYRVPHAAACYARAIRLAGHRDRVVFTRDVDLVTCPDCRERLASDKRRKPARRKAVA